MKLGRIAVGGLIGAFVGGGYGAVLGAGLGLEAQRSHDAQVKAQNMMKNAMDAARRLGIGQSQAPDTSGLTAIRKAQRANYLGRQSTILTSSLGAPSDVNGQKRMLIGS